MAKHFSLDSPLVREKFPKWEIELARFLDERLSGVHEACGKSNRHQQSVHGGGGRLCLRWSRWQPDGIVDLSRNRPIRAARPRVRRIHARGRRMLHVDY